MANSKSMPPRKVKSAASQKKKSIWDDFFANHQSAIIKIGSCAIATPVILIGILRRMARRGGDVPSIDLWMVVLFAIGGTLLGAALALKDVVDQRITNKRPIPKILKLAFGMGIWSLLLIWSPLIIFSAMILSLATL